MLNKFRFHGSLVGLLGSYLCARKFNEATSLQRLICSLFDLDHFHYPAKQTQKMTENYGQQVIKQYYNLIIELELKLKLEMEMKKIHKRMILIE